MIISGYVACLEFRVLEGSDRHSSICTVCPCSQPSQWPGYPAARMSSQ